MKKIFTFLVIALAIISCKVDKNDVVLPTATGRVNQLMVVMKAQLWDGKVGDELRTVFGEHQVGLPQPETLLSVSQVDPRGFQKFMRNNKSILIFQQGNETGIKVVKNQYAQPQTVIYATGKDEHDFTELIKNRGREIIQIFKDADILKTQRQFARKKLNEQQFKTVKDMGVSLTIPESYRFVKDSLGFLWLRQHLKSGIARGAGSNNILLYSVPLEDETKVADNITTVRDMMGEKHIPGSKEGMYMITEKAYTPFTYDAEIDGKKAYETRGKWEVKNDFMAGPFLNYTILDRAHNRLVVFEGFTYAPSINKRDFVFELEAIAKSLKIN